MARLLSAWEHGAPLGYAQVPAGHLGWDGNWGDVPVQGPPPQPADWSAPPKPGELAIDVHVETSWTCPFCKADNDVWGAAGNEWMECSTCSKEAWLAWP
jgi:hypothetical protein